MAQFVPEIGNTIADNLAKLAIDGVDQDWTGEAPQCIKDALAFEALL